MKDDQRVALTKRLLREGLLRLLSKKEIDSVRVSELCAESGINRATFYRHYNQPRDILRDLRGKIMRDVQALALKNRAEENLGAWLDDICQYFFDHADVLRVLFAMRTDDEFVEAIQQLYNEQFDLLRNHGGELQDPDSLKLMTYCYAGGFYYVLRQWIMEPIDKSPHELAAVMQRFLTGK